MPGPDISTGARGEPACYHASMPEVPSGVGPDTSGRAGGVDDAEGAPAARDVSAEVLLQELTADEQPGAGGVRKANVKKGEWRKRGTKARGAEGAETEAPPWVRCDEAPQSVPSSHGTGVHLNARVCVAGARGRRAREKCSCETFGTGLNACQAMSPELHRGSTLTSASMCADG